MKKSENEYEKKMMEAIANKIGAKDILIIVVKNGFHSCLKNLKASVIIIPKSLSLLNSMKSLFCIANF